MRAALLACVLSTIVTQGCAGGDSSGNGDSGGSGGADNGESSGASGDGGGDSNGKPVAPADPNVPPPDCGSTVLENKQLTTGPEGFAQLKGVTRFVGNLLLTELPAGLEPFDLACVEGKLYVFEAAPNALRALSNLQSVTETLKITKGTLTDLTGLAALRSVGSLVVQENPSLTSLRGLSQLARAEEDIQVFLNPKLRTLTGLERLAHVGHQIWVANQAFDGFDSLVGLGYLGGIQFVNVSGVSSLSGLHFIEEMSGSIRLQGVSDIVDLRGLEKIQRITNGLLVIDSPDIRSFDGLGATAMGATDTGGSINARDNPMLDNIEALKKLRSFTGEFISFERNPKLEQCDVMGFDSYLRNELGWTGTLMTGGNATTCTP